MLVGLTELKAQQTKGVKNMETLNEVWNEFSLMGNNVQLIRIKNTLFSVYSNLFGNVQTFQGLDFSQATNIFDAQVASIYLGLI